LSTTTLYLSTSKHSFIFLVFGAHETCTHSFHRESTKVPFQRIPLTLPYRPCGEWAVGLSIGREVCDSSIH
jgi:hypothetical protein